MERLCRLTTVDNPYNPFTQFSEWMLFDQGKGYNTCGLLARLLRTTDEMSDAEVELETERVIDDIIKYDLIGKYIKIYNDETD